MIINMKTKKKITKNKNKTKIIYVMIKSNNLQIIKKNLLINKKFNIQLLIILTLVFP